LGHGIPPDSKLTGSHVGAYSDFLRFGRFVTGWYFYLIVTRLFTTVVEVTGIACPSVFPFDYRVSFYDMIFTAQTAVTRFVFVAKESFLIGLGYIY